MFVVASDFASLEFQLPGLTGEGAINTFPDFVTKQEEKELRKLLGNLFYDALADGINDLPAAWVQKITPNGYAINATVLYQSAVWKSLTADNIAVVVEGINWTKVVNLTVDRWIALNEGAEYKISGDRRTFKWVGMTQMVVPMIYSLWLRFSARQTTTQGVVTSTKENSSVVSSAEEIARGWNEYHKLSTWNCRSHEDTLYGYLISNSADFDDLITDGSYDDFNAYLLNEFSSPGRLNIFDI